MGRGALNELIRLALVHLEALCNDYLYRDRSSLLYCIGHPYSPLVDPRGCELAGFQLGCCGFPPLTSSEDEDKDENEDEDEGECEDEDEDEVVVSHH